jgi:hypothetical protein
VDGKAHKHKAHKRKTLNQTRNYYTMMQEELNLPSPPSSTVVEDHRLSQDSPQKNTSTELPYGIHAPAEERWGHKFCGCMCDMRRAVIAVNIISIVLTVITMIMFVGTIVMIDQGEKQAQRTATNDRFNTDYSSITSTTTENGWRYTEISSTEDWSNWFNVSKGVLAFFIVFQGIGIIFYSLGIRGACKFNKNLVAMAMVYHIADMIWCLVYLNALVRCFQPSLYTRTLCCSGKSNRE